jgi:hypothetical protein
VIPLGPWLPDRPQVREPHLRDAQGVIPAAEGYEPLASLTVQSEATTARARGAFAGRDLDGTVHIYAGDATTLYELDSDASWIDRAKVGGYTATDTTRWRFTTFGDRMLATNGVDPIQYIDMSTGAADFANLPGSPPTAKLIKSFREFVLIGDTGDSAFEIRWCAINDSEMWTIGANQADSQSFPDGGYINAIGVTDVAYIFQEKAIRRMAYVGPPLIMSIDLIEAERGCIEPGSFVQLGRFFAYLAEDGFYLFDGQSSRPIGSEQIDEWFKADASLAYRYRMSAAVDPVHKLFVWSYVSTSSSAGQPDTLLIYNWVADRWSYARVECDQLTASLTKGYTLEGLDAVYPSLDAMPVSLDDPTLTGGSLRFAAFSPEHKLAWFTGSPVAALLETGDFQINPLGRALTRYVTPIADTDDATIKVGAKERQGDSFTWTPAVAQEASGRCPARASGRFFRARLEIPAASTWTHVNGLDVDAAKAGVR